MARSRYRVGWCEFSARLFRYLDCRCSTHRWEFNFATGRSFTDPERYRVRVDEVEVVDLDVLLTI
jgi:nitrite reductase/ring-hydroxylating ferredoxin subunit